MSRTVVVVGVPWSLPEMSLAVRDARSLDARLCVVDTPQALDSIGGSLDCELVSVPSLEPEQVAAVAADRNPDCVVSITELTMEQAARVREILGQPGTSSATERAVTDKMLTRTALRQHGLTSVGFWETPLSELAALVATLRPPLVVKPRAFTGSHGVQLVTQPGDVDRAMVPFDLAEATRFGRDSVLVETFIPGIEVSAEAMVVDRTLTLLAVTDKLNTEAPHFYEVGHVMPSRHTAEWSTRIESYLQDVVLALNIVTSPIHAELKLFDGRVELVEIHSRFGGGSIVRLIEETFALRPYEIYFAGMLDGTPPEPVPPRTVTGVGFFNAPPGPFSWQSYAFPYPDAVLEIDLDTRRTARVVEHQGIRLQFWRAGHALFGSDRYSDVYGNVSFMRSQVNPD